MTYSHCATGRAAQIARASRDLLDALGRLCMCRHGAAPRPTGGHYGSCVGNTKEIKALEALL